MRRIIDLSYPIEDHFRWKVERSLAAAFDRGDDFQITRIGLTVHGFTHIDAPRHMVPGGATTSEWRLESLVGEASVADLRGVEAGRPIDAPELAACCAHCRPGDIVLLMTGWDERFRLHDPRFWSEAPFLTRRACEWLSEREPAAVGFDFPQDFPIRGLLRSDRAPMEEFVSHDVLLRRGVPLIEYVCNLGSIGSERTEVCALPLRLPDADGAPARVIALERDL
ncbi:MAG: cyclase family protein [Acidobacteria bacterium]|nr:cyclase family protein [Acidobacteriota bacterium]